MFLSIALSIASMTVPMNGAEAECDLIIRNGTIYDGLGKKAFAADVAVRGEKIIAVGALKDFHAKREVDARGLAVAPGFINMLSQAQESLIEDGRSQGDIRQGVTLEVMGEGESMGPLNDKMKEDAKKFQADIKYDVTWTTLGGYLELLAKRGVSCNVASFIGAATPRVHEIGYVDRAPTAEELERMKQLVRQAMEEGAMGVASALIYAPGFYAHTDELIALAKVAAEFDGMYISHMRSEGNNLAGAVDEFIRIAREAGIRAEIYHFKAAGKSNWPKLKAAIAKIEAARRSGLRLTADMYTYVAAQTGLDATMPPWVQEGGYEAWAERCSVPRTRGKIFIWERARRIKFCWWDFVMKN